jgi:hypothetical protein
MGILAAIINALLNRDTGPKIDFAGLNPDDLETYFRVDHELDAAEREGGESARNAVWARYGIKNEDHWNDVQYSFRNRHGGTSEFALMRTRAQVQDQIVSFREHYPFPDELMAPIDGVTLDRYSLIEAHVGRAQSPEQRQQILSQYGLDPGRFEQIRSAWWNRINAPDPMISATLGGFEHTYRAVANNWLDHQAEAR